MTPPRLTASGPTLTPNPMSAGLSSAPSTFLPHIVAWNLTKRCNLACAHCYISAGSWQATADELTTEECLRVLDEVLDVNPNPMLILTGGEPLLREDLEILVERAASRGATVVVGTNGTRLTDERVGTLMAAGLKGVAVSVDSLDATYHDRFRHGGGALADTLQAVERCREARLDFVIQTTVTKGNRHELSSLVAWAADAGAVSFNLYFLVPTGRGDRMRGLDPAENERVLAELATLEREYRGRMMIRSKCQPQIMRHVLQGDPDSPLLNYQTRCPCGVHYVRITPEGKITPCPYLPVVAGDLMESGFREIWETSPVLIELREGEVGGRCGECEYRQVCGGCRARAHAETGDLMGPDDSCAYDPPGGVAVVEPRGQISYGQSADTVLSWSPDAREKLAAIPSFVRGVVTARIESFAREKGYDHIDTDVMAEVRRSMPVDFSKKLPFFLRDGNESDEKPMTESGR